MNLKDKSADRSYRNWMEFPDSIRRECLNELKSAIPVDAFSKWINEYRARATVEDDDPFFHFGTGMAVRNILRQRLSDSELAPTDENYWNWDDLYIGALREMLDMADR